MLPPTACREVTFTLERRCTLTTTNSKLWQLEHLIFSEPHLGEAQRIPVSFLFRFTLVNIITPREFGANSFCL